jgi:hypothetical protein
LVDPALVRLEAIIRESTDERIVLSALKEVLSRAGIEPPVEDIRREMDLQTATAVIDEEIARLTKELDNDS